MFYVHQNLAFQQRTVLDFVSPSVRRTLRLRLENWNIPDLDLNAKTN